MYVCVRVGQGGWGDDGFEMAPSDDTPLEHCDYEDDGEDNNYAHGLRNDHRPTAVLQDVRRQDVRRRV